MDFIELYSNTERCNMNPGFERSTSQQYQQQQKTQLNLFPQIFKGSNSSKFINLYSYERRLNCQHCVGRKSLNRIWHVDLRICILQLNTNYCAAYCMTLSNFPLKFLLLFPSAATIISTEFIANFFNKFTFIAVIVRWPWA